MLRVQVLVLDLLAHLKPVWVAIGRKDSALENQLRRAAIRVALHLAEGVGSRGGIKKLRYQTALGSRHEVAMGLQVAATVGYVPAVDSVVARQLDAAGRMIARLARR